MTSRISIAEYKAHCAASSVSKTGRVVPVIPPKSTELETIRKSRMVVDATIPTSAKNALVGPNKFGAKKTKVDGITFDSKAEARRYVQLMDMLRHGLIRGLLRQVRYSLDVKGKKIGSYIADFVYTDTKTSLEVVEDVKGVKTPLYRRSKKHFEAQYGKAIVEITK
jgi:hypothetical protein